MRKTIIFFIISVLNLFVCPRLIFAREPLATTRTLEGLTARWVDLRQEISSEERVWQEQKARLQDEINLLLKEKAILEEDLAEMQKRKSSHEAERAKLIQSKEISQDALDKVLPALSRYEANLKKWRKLLPPSLSSPLDKLFDKLEMGREQSVSQRLQFILSLWGEIERLQSNVHVVKEIIRTNSGREREFEIIYLGLTQGYCVSEDGKFAGIGRPAKDGWVWKWCPQIANEVRKGIDFYKHEKIAEFVKLPLKIEKVEP